MPRFPVPPFDADSAAAKVHAAEDARNARDPRRSYGNELWELDADGYMSRREASINDVPIAASEPRIFGPRVATHPVALQPLR